LLRESEPMGAECVPWMQAQTSPAALRRLGAKNRISTDKYWLEVY
jgi:hypothetical protein